VLGALHMNLGATFISRGEVEAAYAHLRTSQEYFQRARARDFLPELHRHFAEAALRAGDLPQAEVEGRQALSLARELALRGEEGNSLRVLGEIAMAHGQFNLAGEYLGQSVSILGAVGDEYEQARSQLSMARLYHTQKDSAAERAALDQCMPTFERLGAALDLSTARALQET
jgi:tetratricopeptide (TPR) repeat protein